MNPLNNKYLYLLPALLAILLLLITIYDFFTDQAFILPLSAIYAILFILTIILWYIYSTDRKKNKIIIFEKNLKGTLNHYKCPKCNQVFAIKKSKYNNKKNYQLSCPSCQTKGMITNKPQIIHQELPTQKSPYVKFQCDTCQEKITLWSEGSTELPTTTIHSCPYCGTIKPLNQLST